MKNLILSILFSLTFTLGFSQSEKILLKSFPVLSNNIEFELDCEKTISKWEKSYIKVELYVKSNVNQTILDRLSSVGRYDFESKLVDGNQFIGVPKVKIDVKINDLILKETFFMKIWIPETIGKVDDFSI